MPKMRVGFRDVSPSFQAQSASPAPHGHGNGYPYARDEIVLGLTGANYPIIESAGLIKVVQDIELPATNAGNTTDWSTGDYSGLSSATMLPVLKYYNPADSGKKLNSTGNFCFYDALVFSGSPFSGAAGFGSTVTLTITLHEGTGVGSTIWSWGAATIGAGSRVLRAGRGSDTAEQYHVIGNDNSVSEICLRVAIGGAVNQPACRFRLVMFGFEF